MASRVAREGDVNTRLLATIQTLEPGCENVVPTSVRGWLLFGRAGLQGSENAGVRTSTSGSMDFANSMPVTGANTVPVPEGEQADTICPRDTALSSGFILIHAAWAVSNILQMSVAATPSGEPCWAG